MNEPGQSSRQDLKGRFIAVHGAWDERWTPLLELDPDFFESYLDFADVPHVQNVLDPKARALISLAVNAQTTTLHEPGIRQHTARAIALGATLEEVFEVLQLVSLIGMHSIVTGMPIMLEEFEKAGLPVDVDRPLTEREEIVKARFIERRGYWSDKGRPLLVLDADFFEHYANLSSLPWERGVVPPKLKEFIYIAIDAATTHLYESGIRLHIQNSIKYGATPQEIMAVFELISTLGIHSCTVGGRILLDELAETQASGAA
jgi:alkylhydroperoxidase/carboxymuconolactone decarboxylase family protein YurZ